jgi:hypothetical protein
LLIIQNSYNSGTVNDESNVGGLVGKSSIAADSKNGVIENVSDSGYVKVSTSTGGLVGKKATSPAAR